MIDGLVVIDKEAGWTSHDVVARMRHLFGQKKVGHAGTLDPGATGVLLVGLGRVTRLLPFAGDGFKSYVGEMVLGVSTSTLDASGEVVAVFDMSGVSDEDLRRAAAALTGDIEQVPPMVSARSVGGVRLHVLARRGVEVERDAVPRTVSRFEVSRISGGEPQHPEVAFEVTCSSGTYVRQLAEDLGRSLGGGAHLRSLRRIRVGTFGIDEARSVDAVTPADLLSIREALRAMERCEVSGEMADMAAHGRRLDPFSLGTSTPGPWCVVDPEGRPIAVYEAREGFARAAVVIEPCGGGH